MIKGIVRLGAVYFFLFFLVCYLKQAHLKVFIPYLFYPLSELFSKSSQVEKYSSETLTRIALPVALTSFL